MRTLAKERSETRRRAVRRHRTGRSNKVEGDRLVSGSLRTLRVLRVHRVAAAVPHAVHLCLNLGQAWQAGVGSDRHRRLRSTKSIGLRPNMGHSSGLLLRLDRKVTGREARQSAVHLLHAKVGSLGRRVGRLGGQSDLLRIAVVVHCRREVVVGRVEGMGAVNGWTVSIDRQAWIHNSTHWSHARDAPWRARRVPIKDGR